MIRQAIIFTAARMGNVPAGRAAGECIRNGVPHGVARMRAGGGMGVAAHFGVI